MMFQMITKIYMGLTGSQVTYNNFIEILELDVYDTLHGLCKKAVIQHKFSRYE